MTGYQSKKTAALDEEGMYLVHQTASYADNLGKSIVALGKQTVKDIEQLKAQPEQELWCMKMNGCTKQCEDCPDYVPPAAPVQEPVAWIGDARFAKGQFVEGRERRVWWECNTGVGQPLYTTPPQRPWVGLTKDELVRIGVATGLERAAVEMISNKLKEKNNG
jgi:hypothetical protein